MINISAELKEKMRTQTRFTPTAYLTFQDGSTTTIPASRFCIGNNTLVDGSSTSGLPLGVAICRALNLHFFNADGYFNDFDFMGAEIDLQLSMELCATTETFSLGKFTVISPETKGSEVIVNASDKMWKADRPFKTNILFPATIGELYIDICNSLGIVYAKTSFRNSTFLISAAPSGDYTYRQILGYIAMIAGGNARINRDGYMEIMEYNPISSANHSLDQWISNPTVDTEDITVTGVQTTVDGTTYLTGEPGYILSVSNPLLDGKAEEGISLIGGAMNGLTFRKFSGQYIGNPTIEFMDTVGIVRNKITVLSVVTDFEYTILGTTEIENSAESAARNSSVYSSPQTQTLIEAKKLVAAESNARKAAIEQLEKSLGANSGMYQTQEALDDGSSILYFHDKPTLAGSQNVIKITSEAIGFSTDGGKTYPYGLILNGDTITRILTAIGVNADWITVGTIKSQDGSTEIDLENGTAFFGDGNQYIKVTNLEDGSKILRINVSEVNITGRGSVSDTLDRQDRETASMKETVAQLQVSTSEVAIQVQGIVDNGVAKVTTEMGFTFNDEGLNIKKSGEEMQNKLDHTGMYVTRSGETILQANNNGVVATDVTVRNYLIVAGNSRIEQYKDEDGESRGACFWIGGAG